MRAERQGFIKYTLDMAARPWGPTRRNAPSSPAWQRSTAWPCMSCPRSPCPGGPESGGMPEARGSWSPREPRVFQSRSTHSTITRSPRWVSPPPAYGVEACKTQPEISQCACPQRCRHGCRRTASRHRADGQTDGRTDTVHALEGDVWANLAPRRRVRAIEAPRPAPPAPIMQMCGGKHSPTPRRVAPASSAAPHDCLHYGALPSPFQSLLAGRGVAGAYCTAGTDFLEGRPVPYKTTTWFDSTRPRPNQGVGPAAKREVLDSDWPSSPGSGLGVQCRGLLPASASGLWQAYGARLGLFVSSPPALSVAPSENRREKLKHEHAVPLAGSASSSQALVQPGRR